MSLARSLLLISVLLGAAHGLAQQRAAAPEALFEPLDTSESIPVSILDMTAASDTLRHTCLTTPGWYFAT